MLLGASNPAGLNVSAPWAGAQREVVDADP